MTRNKKEIIKKLALIVGWGCIITALVFFFFHAFSRKSIQLATTSLYSAAMHVSALYLIGREEHDRLLAFAHLAVSGFVILHTISLFINRSIVEQIMGLFVFVFYQGAIALGTFCYIEAEDEKNE